MTEFYNQHPASVLDLDIEDTVLVVTDNDKTFERRWQMFAGDTSTIEQTIIEFSKNIEMLFALASIGGTDSDLEGFVRAVFKLMLCPGVEIPHKPAENYVCGDGPVCFQPKMSD